jgi:hypothetical protein
MVTEVVQKVTDLTGQVKINLRIEDDLTKLVGNANLAFRMLDW